MINCQLCLCRIALFAESSAVMDEDDQDDVMMDVDLLVLAT